MQDEQPTQREHDRAAAAPPAPRSVASSPSTSARRVYAERIDAPWWIWAVGLGLAASLGIALGAAAGTAPGLVVGVVTAVLICWALWRSAAHIEVTTERFRAGRASIPLEGLARPIALDAERSRMARGPGADARAYTMLRGWLPASVLVEIVDPHDPTPYWLVSTRHPQRLAAALEQALGTRSS